MNKEFAWLLGYLLSDGCIQHPKYRKKGNEQHLEFICKYSDKNILYKVKNILNTQATVREYPKYKSPQAKITIYDRQDIIEYYNNIKQNIPTDIIGYERHFIRGLVDGDGTISIRHRNNHDICRFAFINEYKQITEWVTKQICETLAIPYKQPRYIPQSHVWEIQFEGNIARIICWWLYHGDIQDCCLDRKRQKYLDEIMDGKTFKSKDEEILYASKCYIKDNYIINNNPSANTLKWCHILQKILSFNTVPIFRNPGKRKYYVLYIPNSKFVANTQDVQLTNLNCMMA